MWRKTPMFQASKKINRWKVKRPANTCMCAYEHPNLCTQKHTMRVPPGPHLRQSVFSSFIRLTNTEALIKHWQQERTFFSTSHFTLHTSHEAGVSRKGGILFTWSLCGATTTAMILFSVSLQTWRDEGARGEDEHWRLEWNGRQNAPEKKNN